MKVSFYRSCLALILIQVACGDSCIASVPVKTDRQPISAMQVYFDAKGLARTSQIKVLPVVKNNPDEPPFMNGEPERLRMSFDNDKLFDYGDYLHRQVLIYPLPAYAALFKEQERSAFHKGLGQLEQILANHSDKGIKEIPVLPAAEAYQVFHNQTKFLRFKHGAGVAFLTSYAQDEAPIKNGDFFYTFQGLSSDAKYYVSIFYPVTVKDLPANLSPAKTAAYLGKLAPDRFRPSLTAIDKAIQSLSWNFSRR